MASWDEEEARQERTGKEHRKEMQEEGWLTWEESKARGSSRRKSRSEELGRTKVREDTGS